MIVRERVLFKSTLPEDIFETEDGSGFLQPPGKSVADALANIVREQGYEVYYGPEADSDFVWGLGMERRGRKFLAGLNLVHDDYFLTFRNPSWTDAFLGRWPAVYLNLLIKISRELEADSRFSDVRWFEVREGTSDVPGKPHPVEETSPRRGSQPKR